MIFVDLSTFFLALKTALAQAGRSPRRILWICISIFAVTLVYTVNVIGRLLDEVLFPDYRDVRIRPPLIIAANPRSGTTYLHRLLVNDGESLTCVKLYHTLFPSVTLCRVFDFFAWVDRAAGSPLARMVSWLDGILFGGWANMHSMGLGRPEEDEALFLFSFATPALYMLFPFFHEVPDLAFADRLPQWKRDAIAKYYASSVRRILYATGGKDRTLLLKSVLFAGRMKIVLGVFPGARIVHLVRHPCEVLPSTIDMFSAFWRVHSPEIQKNSEESRGWAGLCVEYYRYFHENRGLVDASNLISMRYDELKADPVGTIRKIYGKFGLPLSGELLARVENMAELNHNFKSNHEYSLEDYGIDRRWVYDELKDIFEAYGFDH